MFFARYLLILYCESVKIFLIKRSKRKCSVELLNELLKNHRGLVIRVCAAATLVAVITAFIFYFRAGKLPYAADGDAFGTVYAYESAESESE